MYDLMNGNSAMKMYPEKPVKNLERGDTPDKDYW